MGGNDELQRLTGYRVSLKTSAISTPANAWVFVDEHQNSLNDGYFVAPVVSDGQGTRGDVAGWYHNRACGFAFSDGHSIIKKWKDPRTVFAVTNHTQLINAHTYAAGNSDIEWLRENSSVKAR